MSLARHSIFSQLAEIFTGTFGDLVVFTLKPGTAEESTVTFQAIVREEGDEMNESAGGAGTMGDFAYLRLANEDGSQLSEDDTLLFQTITFRIASVGRPDGRGMMHFDLARVA